MQGGSLLPTPGIAGERNGPAWEQRQQLGFWRALVDTVKAVLTLPVQCFSTMKREGGIGSPFLFWLVTAGVGAVVSQLYGLIIQGAMAGAQAAQAPSSQAAAILQMQTAMGASALFIGPIIMIIFLFLWAGLVHLCLMMLKGANQPFETTFRTMAYSLGATGVFSIIPMCGGYIAGIWGIVAMCIGLGPAHGTTTGKGVGATLLSLLFCAVVCGVIIFGFAAVMVGAAKAASGGSGF